MKTSTKNEAYEVDVKGKHYEVKSFVTSDTHGMQYNIFEDGGEFLFSLLKDNNGGWKTDDNTEHPESGDLDFDPTLPASIGMAIDKRQNLFTPIKDVEFLSN